MEYLGLHNKPKAAVHPERLPMGPLKKKKKYAITLREHGEIKSLPCLPFSV
jgi:hypothetical protein